MNLIYTLLLSSRPPNRWVTLTHSHTLALTSSISVQSPLSFKKIFYFNWRITTLQYCDGFCHTSAWIGHRYRCVPPIPEPPSQLPLHPNPLGCPIAPALGAPPVIALALFLFLPSENYSPPNSHESYQVFPHLKPSRGISSILNAG